MMPASGRASLLWRRRERWKEGSGEERMSCVTFPPLGALLILCFYYGFFHKFLQTKAALFGLRKKSVFLKEANLFHVGPRPTLPVKQDFLRCGIQVTQTRDQQQGQLTDGI